LEVFEDEVEAQDPDVACRLRDSRRRDRPAAERSE
jgi:hypothetical protein